MDEKEGRSEEEGYGLVLEVVFVREEGKRGNVKIQERESDEMAKVAIRSREAAILSVGRARVVRKVQRQKLVF